MNRREFIKTAAVAAVAPAVLATAGATAASPVLMPPTDPGHVMTVGYNLEPPVIGRTILIVKKGSTLTWWVDGEWLMETSGEMPELKQLRAILEGTGLQVVPWLPIEPDMVVPWLPIEPDRTDGPQEFIL